NLSPQQWVEVRTQAFKEKYGNWEVVQMETPIHKSKGKLPNLDSAEKWAKINLQGKSGINQFTGEQISISRKSIKEMLNEYALIKSVDVRTHLSALQSVLDFIITGIPAEIHRDTHGRYFNVMRIYNAIEIDGKIYRVKSTIRKVLQGDKYYSYEIQKMELTEKSGPSPDREGETPRNGNNSINSITGAKLLKGVKKTNSDEDILPHLDFLDENGEPRLSEITRTTQATPEAGDTNHSSAEKHTESLSHNQLDQPDTPHDGQLVQIDFNSIFDAISGRNHRKTLPMQKRIEYAQQVIKRIDASHIKIYMTPNDLPPKISKQFSTEGTTLGFFDPRTDQAGIFLERATTKEEIERVIMHEIVGHRGIRAIFGPGTAYFYQKVFEGMPPKAQKKYFERYGEWQTAADEYIADIAAGMYNLPGYKEIWKDIKSIFRYFVRKVHPQLKINDSDIHLYLQRARLHGPYRTLNLPSKRIYPTNIEEAQEVLKDILPQLKELFPQLKDQINTEKRPDDPHRPTNEPDNDGLVKEYKIPMAKDMD
ncbi:MAG: hypothetical protein J1E02_05890, partial [Coprobacter sp.]|nr:hypothetical protein [Coprobacter sp.]